MKTFSPGVLGAYSSQAGLKSSVTCDKFHNLILQAIPGTASELIKYKDRNRQTQTQARAKAERPWASRHLRKEAPWGNAAAPARQQGEPTGAPKTQPREARGKHEEETTKQKHGNNLPAGNQEACDSPKQQVSSHK